MGKLGNFFNKLMYGDPNKKDFTAADLPKNRYELFWDVLKIRVLGLMGVNLVFLLFALPIIIFLFFSLFAISEQYKAAPNMPIEDIIGNLNWTVFFCIPLFALTGPAQAGMTYVIRNWAWGESASPWSDFWKEYKRSWGKATLYSLLCAIFFYAVFYYVSGLMLNPDLNKIVFYLIVIVLGILSLLFLLMNVYVYPIMVTFNLKFKQILKNSLIFGLLQLPKNILFILGVAAVYLLVALLPQLLAVIMLAIGFAVITVAQMIYCNSVFDKYIKYITDEDVPTRRGLAPLDEEKEGKK